MSIFKRTFYSILALVTVFLSVITLLFFLEGVYYRESIEKKTSTVLYDRLYAETKLKAMANIEILGESLRTSYKNNDRDEISRILEKLSINPDIVGSIALSSENKILSSFSSQMIPHEVEKLMYGEDPVWNWNGTENIIKSEKIIVLRTPVTIDPERQGGLIVIYSAPSIETSHRDIRDCVLSVQKETRLQFFMYSLGIFLALFVIAVIISFLLAKYISTPLIEIGSKIKDLAPLKKEDHDERQNKLCKDEIETIKNIINETTSALSRTTVKKSYLKFLLENMDDAILVFDEEGSTLFANLPATTILGDDRLSSRLIELLSQTDFSHDMFFEKEIKNLKIDITIEKEDRVYLLSTSILKSPQKEVLAVLRDVTEQIYLAETAKYNSIHDPLTGLLNRTGLIKLLKDLPLELLNHCWLFAFDIERFNKMNMGLGYKVGDKILQTIGARINNVVHHYNHTFRTGGDEFAAVVKGLESDDEARKKIKEIELAIRRPVFIEDREVWISVNTCAIKLTKDKEPDEILQEMSKRIHQDKAQKRGLSFNLKEDPFLETDFRRALQEDALELFYQPIVDIETGKVHALEALARWNHPTRGSVSPESFIPLAEDTGLILLMGKQIVQKALMDQKKLVEKGLYTMIHINVSPRQFANKSIVEAFQKGLKDNQIDPSTIIAEITESCLIQDKEKTLQEIRELKDMGISISIDDFGTGYSSLSSLQETPFDQIKMDKSLLPTPESGFRDSLARSVINIARELDKLLVVEGVETEEQLEALRSIGARYIQGFVFSRSLKLEEVIPLFKRNHLDQWLPKTVVDSEKGQSQAPQEKPSENNKRENE